MRPVAMHCKPWLAPFGCAVFCAALGLIGCKRHPEPEVPPADSSAPAATPPPPPRCSEPNRSASFTLGERVAGVEADAGDDSDDDQSDQPGLPFAVEIGAAVAFGDGYAVSALHTKGGATEALVALIDADAKKGKIANLGRLHGDPDPPDLASLGADLVALVHDTDAGGERLRLVKLQPEGDKVGVVLGAEVVSSRDQARVAHVDLGKERGVVLFDQYDKAEKHGVIKVVSFDKQNVSSATRARVISASGDDAEAPRVVRRPGGFWAAWFSHGPAGKPKPAALAGKPLADAGNADDDRAPGPAVVELGERWLTIVPLDENGAVTAEPRALTAKKSHVIAFDLATEGDGAALVAWRDDDTMPGAEGRRVLMARVRPDGSAERSEIEDDRIGVGAPSLLVDERPKDPKAPPSWIAIDGVSDATRFGALSPTGALLDTLDTDPSVRSGDLLLSARGRLLVAHPRGLAVELGVIECKPGPPPAPDAGAAPAGSSE